MRDIKKCAMCIHQEVCEEHESLCIGNEYNSIMESNGKCDFFKPYCEFCEHASRDVKEADEHQWLYKCEKHNMFVSNVDFCNDGELKENK